MAPPAPDSSEIRRSPSSIKELVTSKGPEIGSRRTPQRQRPRSLPGASELLHPRIGELLVEIPKASPFSVALQGDTKPDRKLKRRRSAGNSKYTEIRPPDVKRIRSSDNQISSANSVPFWGDQAIKPLTETNLKLLQDKMSPANQSLSRRNSAKHQRVSAL